MDNSSTATGLIIPKDGDVNSALERRMNAEKIANYVCGAPAGTSERWRRIRRVWSQMEPGALEDHRDAVIAAADALKNAEDKEFGTTRATRGKAYGEEVNGHVRNAMVAILPETLKTWLVRFDPFLNKAANTGRKEQRQAWRRLYATFPEYRTTTKQGTF